VFAKVITLTVERKIYIHLYSPITISGRQIKTYKNEQTDRLYSYDFTMK